MPRYKIAHIQEQGQQIIIIPLESSFGDQSNLVQRQTTAELQMRASSAGLAGTVVPVWDAGGGRMGYLAPNQWHPYFSSINLPLVGANLNGEIYW